MANSMYNGWRLEDVWLENDHRMPGNGWTVGGYEACDDRMGVWRPLRASRTISIQGDGNTSRNTVDAVQTAG